jgi:hypothetical protein
MSFWKKLFGGGGGGTTRKAVTAQGRPQSSTAGARSVAAAVAAVASRTCDTCGATFPQSTSFCPRCGKTFGAAGAAAPAPAPMKSGESVAKAVQLYNDGKVEEAIGEAKRLIDANPEHATAHGSLGYFLLQERRFDEAIEPMLRALELKPNSKETALHLRDVIDAYVEELVGIGATDGFVSKQEGGKYDEHRCHRRAREIGTLLARIGDSGVFGESGSKYTADSLMTKVFNEVQVRMSFKPESTVLRTAWQGLGANAQKPLAAA